MQKCTRCSTVALNHLHDKTKSTDTKVLQSCRQLRSRASQYGNLQIWKRTSIITTVWNYVYDHLLCDILHPGEAFIDFIAVSEKARYDAAHTASVQRAQDTLGMQGFATLPCILVQQSPAQTCLHPWSIHPCLLPAHLERVTAVL